jgi:hypothetical protein
MAVDYRLAEERFMRSVERLARWRIDAAVLHLEADRNDIRRQPEAGIPKHDINKRLLQAARTAEELLRSEGSRRSGWGEFHFVLRGDRETLVAQSIDLIKALMRRPVYGQFGWRAILIRIFPGDAQRTHMLDAGYGLEPIKAPAVIWVEPYPHDDWEQSQRYPTVTQMWPSP